MIDCVGAKINQLYAGATSYSLLHALDSNRLGKKSYSYREQAVIGAKVGLVMMWVWGAAALSTAYAGVWATSNLGRFSIHSMSRDGLLVPMLVNPVWEEVLVRGAIQSVLIWVSKLAESREGAWWSRIKWSTNPTSRVLISQFIFAMGHYKVLNTGFIALTAAFMLVPKEAILRETTGNIIAPITAHLTQNVVSTLLMGATNLLGL
ncbi:MAG: CPBP family intramembrane metalloprotease [Chlamydiales bacterium]|nr:CPBP family intramembrane metalloprotease [Chlamydiales bacterium]